ncbi:alpha/beta hydrolase fold domain-containing protein [Kribbella catacumbae]|uniref:alpha/beta hydrolase fold domain-containing protein n=1 Tax=Kribbella catacumbae TaxID=460086 RepID=UPI000376702A|nr:alpha/beta hydrolase fold domain-containing protein [Kribbella catacumbae]
MNSEAAGRLLALPKAPDAIELRHLRAFVAVAEELNFSRAAERMFITQPALSRQIRHLERLLSVDLLTRSTHRVELTVAGEALLVRTRPLLGDLDEALATTQSVGGENQQRLARLTQPVIDRMLEGLDSYREAFEVMNAPFPTPAGVTARPVNAAGVPCLVYGTEPGRTPTVVYAHGGGNLAGSAYGSRPLAGILAVACDAAVLVPDFRLAPEHRYPAAVEDVEIAFRWLSAKLAPKDITLIGDSSGAGLVMSLLHRLRVNGEPMPGRVVLLSPWVDPQCRFLDRETEASPQARAVRDSVDMCVPTYLGQTPRNDPAVNALEADLTGYPAMLIQVGTGDFVVHEARELATAAQAAGVPADLELYPVNTHVFQLFWSFLPEAAKAIERVGQWVNSASAADRTEAG